MNESLKRIGIAEGIFFSTVRDSRFKTNRISINLVTELNRETVTANALLSQLLVKGYQGCETYTALNRKLEELYGAKLESDIQKKGDYQILSLAITGVDDRFALQGESIAALSAAILCGLVFHPVREGDGFPASYVALEKTALMDTIEAEINEKRIFALQNTYRLMCQGEPFGLPKYGFIEDVEPITPQSAMQRYRELIETARIEILFTGCGEDEEAVRVFRESAASLKRSYRELPAIVPHNFSGEVKEKTDRMEVTQSKMVLGFYAGVATNSEQAPAMRMAVGVLGGTPSAKLFVNVREKLSLCYYCAARYEHAKGIITIDSGVEKENVQKAREEILNQLQAVKQGDFTDEEMKIALLSLKNSYSSIYEYDASIDNFTLSQILSGTLASPEEEKGRLERVTRQEIIAAAGLVTLDTVYLLTGNEG